MSVNIKIGGNVLENVDAVQLESADEQGTFIPFVPDDPPVLIEKTITENGTYNASDFSADGFSKVIVQLPANKTAEILSKTVTELTADDFAGATKIGAYTIYRCLSLLRVTLPNTVTRIENNAFQNCNALVSITLNDGLTFIGQYSIQNCAALTSLDIPSTVTEIGQYAFYYGGFTSITIRATTPPTMTRAFDGSYPIYVPAASVNDYKSATNWSTYASRIQAIPE